MSKSTATHHFTVLREASMICKYCVGTGARMNALRPADLETQRYPACWTPSCPG
ncbi:hypothetical protein [Jiangella asiatica]|uniref:hypothetical protein n=1 Tax=Jiangella asiatica TaxID=2530372 RepID=UPI0013A5C4D7|nr:hypothetical protein [Jiangella asiatica]